MLELILGIVILALDQASKFVCASWLTTLPNNTFSLIPGVFELTYVENRGAAFGMMQNARWFFLVATVLVCVGIIVWMIRERKLMPKLMRVCLALIAAGALGNFIDRAVFGYVRDMFSFVLINFAVFNVADSALTVGTALLVIDLLFGGTGRYFNEKDRKKSDAKKKQAETENTQEKEAAAQQDASHKDGE